MEKREELAELYFLSDSFKPEPSKLSAHLDNPDLPESPFYLHYPKETEPGYKYLPRIAQLSGMLFYDMAVELGIEDRLIAAVPEGANPLARQMAMQSPKFPNNLLTFAKQSSGNQTLFLFLNGEYEFNQEVIGIDDHTSGGRNKRLFQLKLGSIGLRVTHFFDVVDREQGAREVMRGAGVAMRSIFTITELLEIGVMNRYIHQDKADEILHYVKINPIPTQH